VGRSERERNSREWGCQKRLTLILGGEGGKGSKADGDIEGRKGWFQPLNSLMR